MQIIYIAQVTENTEDKGSTIHIEVKQVTGNLKVLDDTQFILFM